MRILLIIHFYNSNLDHLPRRLFHTCYGKRQVGFMSLTSSGIDVHKHPLYQ